MPLLLALRWWEQGLSVTPPPVEPPEEDCFPSVPPPVTAFSRSSLAGIAFSRGTKPATATFVITAAQAITRVDAPACALLGIGWGDDYGEDYGGAGGLECFVPADFSGPIYSRMDGPGCAPAIGWGDDYGENYGGG